MLEMIAIGRQRRPRSPHNPVSGLVTLRRPRIAVPRRLVSTGLLLAAWQAASLCGLISPQVLASPVQIGTTTVQLAADGTLPHNLAVSLLRACVGFSAALVLGVTLALVAGLSRLGEDVIDAPLQMLRTLPSLALIPLFILWFGIGEAPKLALVILGCLFSIYLNLFKGIRSVDPKLLEMARVLRLSRAETIRTVVLPSAVPDLLVGVRHSAGIAWLMLVVAEQVNAQSGIGHMMTDAQDFLRTDIIMVGLLVYALLGLGSDMLVRRIEHRALAWRQPFTTLRR